eukprot:1425020-Heterocapsa_arctica.AAC.1
MAVQTFASRSRRASPGGSGLCRGRRSAHRQWAWRFRRSTATGNGGSHVWGPGGGGRSRGAAR